MTTSAPFPVTRTTSTRPANAGRAHTDVRKETEMLLLQEELARGHQAQLHREAEREVRVRRLAALRRWQRRAEAAGRRARAAAAAVR